MLHHEHVQQITTAVDCQDNWGKQANINDLCNTIFQCPFIKVLCTCSKYFGTYKCLANTCTCTLCVNTRVWYVSTWPKSPNRYVLNRKNNLLPVFSCWVSRGYLRPDHDSCVVPSRIREDPERVVKRQPIRHVVITHICKQPTKKYIHRTKYTYKSFFQYS